MRTRFIPDNILQGKRIAKLIKPRNLAEGIVWCLIITYIFFEIPFAPLFRWIMIVVIGATALALNCIGIKNQSYSEAVINYLRMKNCTKQIDYRRINNVKTKFKPILQAGHLTAGKDAIAVKWYKRLSGK